MAMVGFYSSYKPGKKVPAPLDKPRADIVYFKSPWTNVGNAFIDIGAMFQLSEAHPQHRVHVIGGGMANILINYVTLKKARKIRKLMPTKAVRMLKKTLGNRYDTFRDSLLGVEYSTGFSFELITAVKAEYVVLSGVALSRWFVSLYKDILVALSKKGSKIVFLGGGAVQYTDDEAKFVGEFLKEVKPYAIITRDSWSFNRYGGFARHSYDGIDAGFFVGDAVGAKDVKLDLPKYVIFTFDKIPEPKVDTELMVIRLHHASGIFTDLGSLMTAKPNTFVSDSPYDYLLLYANAEEVHTDRVHSCVAACAYEKPCRLYLKSSRAKLFERIDVDPFEKLVKPESGKIRREKDNQIKFLKEILDLEGQR